MTLGGGGLALVGLAFGEGGTLPAHFSSHAVLAFVWLMVVGSLVGFIAFNYLLGEVSATKVGTYAYVNPLVAILVAWFLGDGQLTLRVLGGMAIVLIGVALWPRWGRHAFASLPARTCAGGWWQPQWPLPGHAFTRD